MLEIVRDNLGLLRLGLGISLAITEYSIKAQQKEQWKDPTDLGSPLRLFKTAKLAV